MVQTKEKLSRKRTVLLVAQPVHVSVSELKIGFLARRHGDRDIPPGAETHKAIPVTALV